MGKEYIHFYMSRTILGKKNLTKWKKFSGDILHPAGIHLLHVFTYLHECKNYLVQRSPKGKKKKHIG